MKAGIPSDRAGDRTKLESILRDRAEALSRPVDEEELADGIQVVVLWIGTETYGIDASVLTEVRPLRHLTAVPNVPPVWSGLIALRGKLIPVLDLRTFLELPPVPDVAEPKVAVVSVAGLDAALLVDDATEVRRVSLQEMDSLPTETRTNGVRAVTPDLLTILDLEAMLADPRLEMPNRASDRGGDE